MSHGVCQKDAEKEMRDRVGYRFPLEVKSRQERLDANSQTKKRPHPINWHFQYKLSFLFINTIDGWG
jgi:hypothetical protein